MRRLLRGRLALGALLVCLGLVWAALAGTGFAWGLRTGASSTVFLLIGVVAVPGVVALFYGMGELLSKLEIAIDGTTVRQTRRSLRGVQRWSVPLTSYQGVLKRSEGGGGAPGRRGPVNYGLVLYHPQQAREVVLYQALGDTHLPPEDWERRWRELAELLSLPMLRQTAEGISAVAPEGQRRPLLEYLRDGSLQPPAMNPARTRLGSLARVRKEADTWIVTLRSPWPWRRNVVGLLILLPVEFLALRLLGISWGGQWAITAALLTALVAWLSFQVADHHAEAVAVDEHALWYRHWSERRGWLTQSIPCAELLDIYVAGDGTDHGGRLEVAAEGRGGEIRFGRWLSRRQVFRLRDLLLSLVARCSVEGAPDDYHSLGSADPPRASRKASRWS
jgi:hypothetical protein